MATKMPVEPRYSWNDLQRAIALPCNREVAATVGVTARTVIRWKKYGIPACNVDHVAVAFGQHPGNIWPGRWWGTSDA